MPCLDKFPFHGKHVEKVKNLVSLWNNLIDDGQICFTSSEDNAAYISSDLKRVRECSTPFLYSLIRARLLPLRLCELRTYSNFGRIQAVQLLQISRKTRYQSNIESKSFMLWRLLYILLINNITTLGVDNVSFHLVYIYK